MALGMTCIPTIREDVIRLQHANQLAELERRSQLTRETAEYRMREPVSHDAATWNRRSHSHWPFRPVHIH